MCGFKEDFLENAIAIFELAGLLLGTILLVLWPLLAFATLSMYFRSIIVFFIGIPVQMLWLALLITVRERADDEAFRYQVERSIEKWKAWAQSRARQGEKG